MADWQKISDKSELQVGDIFEISSKFPSDHPIFPDVVVPIVNHYGIIAMVKDEYGNDQKVVIHNTIFGKPHIDPIDKVIVPNRPIKRIIRTNTPNDEIMDRFSSCSGENYRFWNFNCEDFVSKMCDGCDIGYDQRRGWFGGLTILILIILIIIYYKKQQHG